MHKKNLLVLLLLLSTLKGVSQISEATELEINDIKSGEQIAAGNSIVRDAVMQGIYTFGSTMLNKYTNPTNVYYAPYATPGYTTQTIQTVPQTTTVTVPQTTTITTPTTQETIPDQPEPMVVVQ